MKKLLIGAASSGQGKTTVSLGLMRALVKKGYRVQPFKVGPDYIDPGFHKAACGRASINLDGWLLGDPEDQTNRKNRGGMEGAELIASGANDSESLADRNIKNLVKKYGSDADIAVIEGVMGLYDGAGYDPMDGSSAAVAKLLDAAVLLVISPGASAATSAAVAKGLFDFRGLRPAGVILNGIYSEEHYESVRETMEKHAGLQVFGYMPTKEELKLGSRHLGLTQSCEKRDLEEFLETLADTVIQHIEIERLMASLTEDPAESIENSEHVEQTLQRRIAGEKRPVLAVARDEAFNFYYEDNLRRLEEAGAELRFYSPLRDEHLPEGTKGLYFGGGYPEVFAGELERNQSIRKEIKECSERGLPIFAECGGLMYLQKTIRDMEGIERECVGIFDGKAEMTPRLQNFGYNTVECIQGNWLLKKGEKVRGHEFHKSTIYRDQIPAAVKMEKQRKEKLLEWQCGMIYKNVFGLYPHLNFGGKPELADRFVEAMEKSDAE